MTQETFPKATNSLLSQDEKRFLDDMPDAAVAKVFSDTTVTGISLSHIHDEGVTLHTFENERAQAVRDYYEMLFAYGVRKDTRKDG